MAQNVFIIITLLSERVNLYLYFIYLYYSLSSLRFGIWWDSSTRCLCYLSKNAVLIVILYYASCLMRECENHADLTKKNTSEPAPT